MPKGASRWFDSNMGPAKPLNPFEAEGEWSFRKRKAGDRRGLNEMPAPVEKIPF